MRNPREPRCPHCGSYLDVNKETNRYFCPEPSCGAFTEEDEPWCDADGFCRAADCVSGYGNE